MMIVSENARKVMGKGNGISLCRCRKGAGVILFSTRFESVGSMKDVLVLQVDLSRMVGLDIVFASVKK